MCGHFYILDLLPTYTYLNFTIKGTEPLLTQPHTLTPMVINTQGFPEHSLPLSKKRQSHNLPSTPSSPLCALPPSISPQRPQESVGPGEKSRMAQFFLVSVWPGPFPALHLEHRNNGLWSLSILTFSNSLVAHFL